MDQNLESEETTIVECLLNGKDTFNIIVVPRWAPLGSERFLALVNKGFYDSTALFRVVKGFLVQFGIAKDTNLNIQWRDKAIEDDPKIGVKIEIGTLAFAGSGKDSRTTQVFISLGANTGSHLGKEPWETPFGYVPRTQMENLLTKLNYKYKDMPPWVRGYLHMLSPVELTC